MWWIWFMEFMPNRISMQLIALVCYMSSHMTMSTKKCLGITSLEANIKSVSLDFTMGVKGSFGLYGWLKKGFVW